MMNPEDVSRIAINLARRARNAMENHSGKPLDPEDIAKVMDTTRSLCLHGIPDPPPLVERFPRPIEPRLDPRPAPAYPLPTPEEEVQQVIMEGIQDLPRCGARLTRSALVRYARGRGVCMRDQELRPIIRRALAVPRIEDRAPKPR